MVPLVLFLNVGLQEDEVLKLFLFSYEHLTVATYTGWHLVCLMAAVSADLCIIILKHRLSN